MRNNIFLITVILSLLVFNTYAQRGKCPRGNMVKCPGLCGLFIDNNGDGYCDYSFVPENNHTKDSDSCIYHNENYNQEKNDALSNINNKEKEEEEEDKEHSSMDNHISQSDNQNSDSDSLTRVDNIENEAFAEAKEESNYPKYPLITITLLTLIPYFFTNILVVLGKMKRKIHRKIWNYILLITFTVAALLGLFLVLQINYGWMMDNYLANLTLHVEFGISMAIISIIHIIWHWKYYLNRKNDTNC